MNKKVFNEMIKNHKLKPNKKRNCVWAFLCGGLIGTFGQLLYASFNEVLKFSDSDSVILMYFILILITNVLTCLGVFDIYSTYAGAGAFIPITGFANALTSSSLEGRSEGLIFGIGSNMFKLVGSVLVYGISSALIFSFIYYLLSLIGVNL